MDRITDLRVRLSSALQKIADAKRASSETAIKLYEEAEANFLQLGDEERAFRASSLRISTLCKNRPSSYLEHAETVDGFLTTYGTFGETPEYLRHKKTYLNALKAMHHAAAAYRSERDVLTQFLESFSHPDRRKAAGLAEED